MVSISESKGHQSSFSEYAQLEQRPSFVSTRPGNESTELLIPPASIPMTTLRTEANSVRSFSGVWVILIYLLLLVTYEVMIFVVHNVMHVNIVHGNDGPFALLAIMHVGLWLLTFVYDRYLHYHHHALRRYGYLKFFTKTKEIRRIPFMLFSIGNAALLLVVPFRENRHHDNWLPLVTIYQIIASAEVFVCIISTSVYLGIVRSFNRSKRLPDVYDQSFTNIALVTSIPEAGFRDTSNIDEILERQSEMIRYLQQHNEHLGRRIIELTDMLPTDQSMQTR